MVPIQSAAALVDQPGSMGCHARQTEQAAIGFDPRWQRMRHHQPRNPDGGERGRRACQRSAGDVRADCRILTREAPHAALPLQLEVSEGPRAWRPDAQRAIVSRQTLLLELTGTENLSRRFRYYQTGPAEALLLDALAGPSWKSRMLARNGTFQDMVAWESGVDAIATAAQERAQTAFGVRALRASSKRQIERLKASRRAKADSLLSVPGLRFVLLADSLPGKDFNSCGYDPQNLLQVTPGVQIQMRWWKPCAGGPTYAEFNVPSVHDERAGTVSAVIGDAAEVKLTSNGVSLELHNGETLGDVRAFKLDSPRASVQAVRADLSRSDATLTIRPKAP